MNHGVRSGSVDDGHYLTDAAIVLPPSVLLLSRVGTLDLKLAYILDIHQPMCCTPNWDKHGADLANREYNMHSAPN